MSPLGGSAALSPVDRWATVIGRLCAAVCLASIAIAGILLLLMAEKVVAARTWPYVVLFGAALGAWSAAFWTMTWHQGRVGLPAADADDWERRSDSRLGFLVPFSYLLGPPDQRRVARYARRTKRRFRR
jgi:hypothetical protein